MPAACLSLGSCSAGSAGPSGTPRPADGAGRPRDLESGGKWGPCPPPAPDFLDCETSHLRSLEKGRDWDSEGKGVLLLGTGWTNIRFHLRGAPAPSLTRSLPGRPGPRPPGRLAAHPAAPSPGLGRCPQEPPTGAATGSSPGPEPRHVTSPGPRAARRRVPLPAEGAMTHSGVRGVRGGSHGGRLRCDGSARRPRLWFPSESIGGRRRGRPSAETGKGRGREGLQPGSAPPDTWARGAGTRWGRRLGAASPGESPAPRGLGAERTVLRRTPAQVQGQSSPTYLWVPPVTPQGVPACEEREAVT